MNVREAICIILMAVGFLVMGVSLKAMIGHLDQRVTALETNQ